MELGQEIHGLHVIKKGLSKIERVIISGTQRVKPHALVEETMKEPPKAPASPLARLVNALPPVVAAKQSDKETRRLGDKQPGKHADKEAKKDVSGGS